MEALAATAILREECPDLKVRFINVVDLYKLQDDTEHPHGLSKRDFKVCLHQINQSFSISTVILG